MVDTNKLRSVMKLKKYTDQRLADAIGISRQNLNDKINNKFEFTARELQIIKKCLDLSLDAFGTIFL